VLSLGQADVTEIRRQLREKELDVGALTVPSNEPVHGKTVAIMPDPA
jgi:hypothetical protein